MPKKPLSKCPDGPSRSSEPPLKGGVSAGDAETPEGNDDLRIGVLLIHGTFGSPNEYHSLERSLRARGIKTRSVTLPGHGDNPDKSLKHVSNRDMLDHCMVEYDRLAQTCGHVFVVGHSLGGILSLLLGAQNPPNLTGVISLSAPYEHAYFVNYLHGFLKFPTDNILAAMMYAPQSMTRYTSPNFEPWWYNQMQLQAESLFEWLQNQLPLIEAPVFLGHSVHDMIVPYDEMAKINDSLASSAKVTPYTFTDCGHQIYPSSNEAALCTQLLLSFITDAIQLINSGSESAKSA